MNEPSLQNKVQVIRIVVGAVTSYECMNHLKDKFWKKHISSMKRNNAMQTFLIETFRTNIKH